MAWEEYLAARVLLRGAIKEAKTRAWQELLQSLEEGPWGRPYRLVLNKLRPWAPPLMETLDPGFRERVLAELFPAADGEATPLCLPGNIA